MSWLKGRNSQPWAAVSRRNKAAPPLCPLTVRTKIIMHLRTSIAVTFCLIASAAHAFDLPAKAEVVKAEIACRGGKSIHFTVAPLDRNHSLKLLSFLETVNNHWSPWGFITTPAGDIQIKFLLLNERSVVVQTQSNLGKIWTDGGFRNLSQQEREVFQMLIPNCRPHKALQ